MFPVHSLLFLGVLFAQQVWAAITSPRNFLPGSYPLAVRSPYLNVWLKTPSGTETPAIWPTHWDAQNIQGWSGLLRVDGKPFTWLGDPPQGNRTVFLSTAVTPTTTVLTVQAETVTLNISFISPIEPDDLVLQSLPFSYMAVDVISNDGKPHSIQLYSDISAEWISGKRDNPATWRTTQTAKSVFHQATRATPESMREISNLAEDSTVYYAMAMRDKLTWQTGADVDLRNQFCTTGILSGTQDTSFREINNRFPVFALSVDLGTITSTTEPVVWAVGVVRDPVIQYTTESGSESRRSYFWSRFSQIGDAIDAFVTGFSVAEQRAIALDQKILSAAQKVSSKYADLVSLGLRQTLASIDITAVKTGNDWDVEGVNAFMKDTGSSNQINAIEPLFAAFPALLFLNTSLPAYLLESLLAYQSSSLYSNNFAAANLGAGYPVALGNNARSSDQSMEATGNMLVMVWAHAAFSGQGKLISKYYNLLKTWADYLVEVTRDPTGQSSNSLSAPRMTNLLFLGIVGIRAMSSISASAGIQADADKYLNASTSYLQAWQSSSTVSGHLVSSPNSGPALIYNIYPDRLLKFNLVDDSLLDSQNSFYLSQATSAPKYGLPFDSSVSFAKSHWTAFTAATAEDRAQDALIDMIYSRINTNTFTEAFPSVHDVNTGAAVGGAGSPSQGALLSILALDLSLQKVNVPPINPKESSGGPTGTTAKKAAPIGAIVGGVIGGLGAIALVGLVLFLRRRRLQPRPQDEVTPLPFVPPQQIFPSSNMVEAQSLPSLTSSQYAGYISPPASSFDVTSVSGTTRSRSTRTGWSSSTAAQETRQLREEVETLRRAMEDIRAQREYDAPPTYH